MLQKYTISQLAARVGLAPKTIRFYEDEGVITSPIRGENGYRGTNYCASNQRSVGTQFVKGREEIFPSDRKVQGDAPARADIP